MNVVFLMTLEKKLEEDRVATAQLSVAEHQGEWHGIWSEPAKDGRLQPFSWYKGRSWASLLEAFRKHLHEKQSAGYRPLIDAAITQPVDWLGERHVQTMLLQYYSELKHNEELYERLRLWRREQSSKEGKSPFIIASNKSLKLISAFVPHTPDELLQLPGMGGNRVKQYGEAILGITQTFGRDTPFPLDWVGGSIDRTEFVLWMQRQREEQRKASLRRQELKHRLLEGISRGDNVAVLAEQTSLKRRDIVAWVEELEREGYDTGPLLDAELHAVPQDDLEKALGAFELLGDRYLKPVLESVYKRDDLGAKEVERIYEWLRLLRLKLRRQKSPDIVGAS
jgi:hypothetical protein